MTRCASPRLRLDAAQRRWVAINALLVTAVVNLVLNGGIAWATAGDEHVVLWAGPLVGDPSLIWDTLGTLFLLPLITTLIVTAAVRRDLARGESRAGWTSSSPCLAIGRREGLCWAPPA